jgi:hypothetical protein
MPPVGRVLLAQSWLRRGVSEGWVQVQGEWAADGTVIRPLRRFLAGAASFIILLAVLAPGVGMGAANSEAKLRAKARGIAERTYFYAHAFGIHHRRYKRRFSLRGQIPRTVKADDGSLFTAFQATIDSADGTGDIVLLFDEQTFVGWASNRVAGNLILGRRGNRILVRYFVYKGRNSICCPSGKKAITYRWTGSGVAASGKPPLIFGSVGQRLHLGE